MNLWRGGSIIFKYLDGKRVVNNNWCFINVSVFCSEAGVKSHFFMRGERCQPTLHAKLLTMVHAKTAYYGAHHETR